MLTGYKVINSLPILIPFDSPECVFDEARLKNSLNLGSKCRDGNLNLRYFKNKLNKIFIGENIQTKKNFHYLLKYLKSTSKVLVIGGGSIGSGMSFFIVNLYL